MHRTLLVSLLLLLAAILLVDAQSGPIPHRLNIPGAQPIALRPQFRNEKIVRVRRPVALRQQQDFTVPAVTPRALEEPKPVNESHEEEAPDAYLPQLLREQQLAQAQQVQFQQTADHFFNSEPNSIQDFATVAHEEPIVTLPPPNVVRYSERPQPQTTHHSRPQFNDFGIGANIGSQRFGLERPQAPPQAQPAPPRSNVIRSRPAAREPRPQYDAQPIVERNTQPVSRPRPKPIQSRPIEQNIVGEERDSLPKRQRPVAQTLRKWRDENEDGSITWGYENDDGSFKEEFIGTDCITKGTYGYIDPDGNKREYHYETGIKCDPNARQSQENLDQNGFINYEENKAVLPNGIEIDMSQLGKKKSKRPGAILRDQQAQNQYYRN